MSQAILANLRYTLDRLQPAPLPCYTNADREAISALLASTVKNLHTLYPDHLSAGQRHKLLQNLSLLEQQQQRVLTAGTDDPSCPEWRAIHISLQAAIIDTLSDQEELPYPNT